jgi:hypothetical protein
MPKADLLTAIREPLDLDLPAETALSIIMNEPGTYGPLNPRLEFAMRELCRQVIEEQFRTK